MSETPSIVAGSLDASFEATFPIDDFEAFAGLMGHAEPLRHDVRVIFPDGADRHCPICREPAEAMVLESATLVPFKSTTDGETITFQTVGVAPAAYRCEPCGHRFDRDGTEIADA